MVNNQESYFKEEEIDGEKWYIVTIKDNGIGWDWDDMPAHVREKYLKGKKNIELLRGEFSYENIPYEGSKVTLKIPSYVVKDIETLRRLMSGAVKKVEIKKREFI